MKILFLAPANSIHTMRWVSSLSSQNTVLLLSLPNHRMLNIYEDKLKIEYLPIQGKKGYYLNAFFVKKKLEEFCPDIVNVHYASGYGTLARISHIPSFVLSVWGSDVYDFPYRNWLNKMVIKKNLYQASYITSTSEAMKKQVKRLISLNNDIRVIPFGVDIKQFSKKNIEKSNNKFVFCVVKSLEKIYGIDIIIDAFSQFMKRTEFSDEIELHIYGTGSQETLLKEVAYKKKCKNNIKWCGHIENRLLPQVLSEVDVFCVGSRKESFGTSTVEAMSMKLPVIATETDGAKEIIIDKVTGIIVKQEAAKEMSLAMEYLYKNADVREKMGSAGRERVKKLYNWDENVKAMLLLFKNILGDSNGK